MAEPARKPIKLHREMRDGHAALVDERGIVRYSRNPRDAAAAERRGFDVNRHRLIAVETMIADRYGGPCDCDDARAYLSLAFNAIAISRRLSGWKADPRPLIEWAQRWTPTADPAEVEKLAIAVTTAPRWISAAKAGALMAATEAEIKRLRLRTVWASDRSIREIRQERKKAKNKADRERLAAARAAKRGRAGDDVRRGSVTIFSKTHGLPRRTVYRHIKNGTLESYLDTKGIQARPDGWHKSVAPNRERSSNKATHLCHAQTGELGASILAFHQAMLPAIRAAASAAAEINRKVAPIGKAARRLAASTGARR